MDYILLCDILKLVNNFESVWFGQGPWDGPILSMG